MIKQITKQVRVHPDGDPMSLGVGCITNLDVPAGMELDARGGTLRWVAEERDFDYRELTFEYFTQANVRVSADKTEIVANGVENLTLSVECEDDTLESVPIAVLEGDTEVGVIDVDLSNGVGEHVMTISEVGTYTFQVDNVMSLDWPDAREYRDDGRAVVEAT